MEGKIPKDLILESSKVFICSAWISCSSATINFFSHVDIIKVSKIQQIYCYFKENTSMDFRKVRTWKIIPYRMILITGLSLVRKINILLWVCKTEKVYILHARHFFLCCLGFSRTQDYLIFYSLNKFVFK